MAQTTGFVPPMPRFQLVVPETGPFAESNIVFDSHYQNTNRILPVSLILFESYH